MLTRPEVGGYSIVIEANASAWSGPMSVTSMLPARMKKLPCDGIAASVCRRNFNAAHVLVAREALTEPGDERLERDHEPLAGSDHVTGHTVMIVHPDLDAFPWFAAVIEDGNRAALEREPLRRRGAPGGQRGAHHGRNRDRHL